jgi:hypothetical protein
MTPAPPPRLSLTALEDRLTPTSPVPRPDGIVVTGAGPGGPPEVQVYRRDGSIRAQFLAYDAAFRGGVSVAMADVNADGVPDVITAAGGGGGPHVKVFDGTSVANLFDPTRPSPAVVIKLTELYSFFAYDPNFRGGVSVAAGDVDADGYADVITGAGAGGGPHVKAFSGKSGAEIRSFFAYGADFRGGVNVAAGELQDIPYPVANDPLIPLPLFLENADILVGSGAGMRATVKGFNGRTGEEFFTINPYGDFTGGVYVASGDMTADGFDDVMTGAGAGGGPHVTVYDGFTLGHLSTILFLEGGPKPLKSFYAFDPNFRGGVRVGAGDLWNDDRVDVLAAAGPGGGPHVKAFSGSDDEELFSRYRWNVAADTSEFTAGSSIAGTFAPRRRITTSPIPLVSALGTEPDGLATDISASSSPGGNT